MNANDLLADTLTTLGYADADGLVDERTGYDASGRGFVWRELHNKAGVDAAYFLGGVPLVAFLAADRTAIERTHRRLWNLSRVPLLIACTDSDVAALSCYVAPERSLWESDATLLLTSDEAAREALLEFSRFHVESGRVSETYADRFRRAGRVDRLLLDNLRTLRVSLAQAGESGRAVDRLIGLSIFVRYFEDRGILDRDHTIELAGSASRVRKIGA